MEQQTINKPSVANNPQTQNIEPGDHERYSHYVRKDKVVESAVMGNPVVALCGKVWIPNRDPEKFPVCPECKGIYEEMKKNEDGQGSGDE
jgi:hypothetical protein